CFSGLVDPRLFAPILQAAPIIPDPILAMTEAEIRDAIVKKVSASAAGRGAAFISELHIDGFARRADLVVANGKLAAFEIKTSRDTLARLPGQLQSYRRFFEQVTVVCAEKHLAGVMALAEESVGVWVVTPANRLQPIRKAQALSLSKLEDWFSFLPVDELRGFARSQGVPAIGTRSDLLASVANLACKPTRDFVLDFLKRRKARIEALQRKYPRLPVKKDPVAEVQDAMRRYADALQPALPLVGIPRRVASKVV
ncbi:MAG: hypothetical protein JWQ11_2799, partial [Rhizobacter sp.]|nr:hypothetical protein [Rhizobacter sp.]